jgi:hypothetical protein
LAIYPAKQHNSLVSSNFVKELDLARSYQRAFFCQISCDLSAAIAPMDVAGGEKSRTFGDASHWLIP